MRQRSELEVQAEDARSGGVAEADPFIVTPTRAIAIPFLLDSEAFKKSAILQSGVLIDGLQLLRDLRAPDPWLDDDTMNGLVAWLEPSLAGLAVAA